MNRNILIGAGVVVGLIAVAIGGVAVAASMQPDQLVVERNIDIAAPPEDVHAAVGDFKTFATWTPWDFDPNMVVETSDPSTGVGAWYTWKGNQDVGSGRMELSKVEPLLLEVDLEFKEPMAGLADVTYTLTPNGDTTNLSWKMEMDQGFGGKVAALFMDMDGMIGADFERGLGRVKAKVESGEVGAPEPPVAEDEAGAAAGGSVESDATDATDATDDTDAG
mgnify:CR=1 FL=1